MWDILIMVEEHEPTSWLWEPDCVQLINGYGLADAVSPDQLWSMDNESNCSCPDLLIFIHGRWIKSLSVWTILINEWWTNTASEPPSILSDIRLIPIPEWVLYNSFVMYKSNFDQKGHLPHHFRCKVIQTDKWWTKLKSTVEQYDPYFN